MGRSAPLFGPLSKPMHMCCSSLFRTGLTSSVRLCKNPIWNNEEQRSERIHLRRIAHPGTDANLDGWLPPCAARPTTPLAGFAEKFVRTERCLQVWTGGITETCHQTQDQDHDCNYIHSIEIPVEPSGLVGELSSSATQ